MSWEDSHVEDGIILRLIKIIFLIFFAIRDYIAARKAKKENEIAIKAYNEKRKRTALQVFDDKVALIGKDAFFPTYKTPYEFVEKCIESIRQTGEGKLSGNISAWALSLFGFRIRHDPKIDIPHITFCYIVDLGDPKTGLPPEYFDEYWAKLDAMRAKKEMERRIEWL